MPRGDGAIITRARSNDGGQGGGEIKVLSS